MGAFSKAKTGQRIHRERTQPENRKKYGLLEKKKDYKKRALDYQTKEKELKKLRKHAIDRNPDEFHHHMVNSLTKDGQHFEKEKEDEETLVQKQLGDVKDLEYVKNALYSEEKKIASMQAELHLMDTPGSSQAKHTIFVDDDDEARRFDTVSYFDTDLELVGRRANRIRRNDLSTKPIYGADSKPYVEEVEEEARVRYNELKKRIERAKELRVVVAKLELKKHLAKEKGSELRPQKVKKGKANKAAVYKFPLVRKR